MIINHGQPLCSRIARPDPTGSCTDGWWSLGQAFQSVERGRAVIRSPRGNDRAPV